MSYMTLMSSYNPFRPAGGARSIHDVPNIISVYQAIRLFRQRPCQKVFVPDISFRHRPVAQIYIPALRDPKFVFDAIYQVHERSLNDKPFAFRVIDNVLNFGPRETKHDRNNHLAALGATGIAIHPLPAVIGNYRKSIFETHSHVI